MGDRLYLASDYKQFRQATLDLNDAIKKDSSIGNMFNENQLQEIARGRTPSGYTWHHNQEEGVLQLVEKNVHQQTGHTGGRTIWGGGNDYR
ncbi:HNH endonuclease [Methanolobus psychrotolerans]|uniref:HNH endonuclease n=1 Tax=Methanolobus psychrotolerans TaxID=1874706 RepID=UPI0037427C06